MKVLVACEESQAVTIELRRLGHEAYSCDLIECSGGHPEWHIQQSVSPLLNGRCSFKTSDGVEHQVSDRWDMILAFPPCTFLTVTGNRWFDAVKYGYEAQKRWDNRCIAICFFLSIAYADCDRIAIENPIGCMNRLYRKPDQIIHPYMFGAPARKSTCLWLKGLSPLKPTEIVEPEVYSYVAANGKIKTDSRWRSQLNGEERAKHRSKTFPGVARAMAEQWAGQIQKEC